MAAGILRRPALAGFMDRQSVALAADANRIKELLPATLQSTKTPAETAALILACRAILNTDAFITRE